MTDNMHEESEGAAANKNRTFTAITTPQTVDGLALPPNHPNSFGPLLKRAIPAVWRNRKQTFFLYAFYVSMAVFLGTSQNGIGMSASKVMDNVRCIFFVIASTTFIGMLPTIVTLPHDMAEFTRDYRQKYSMMAFYLAKNLIELPQLVLVSSIYGALVYTLTSQPIEFAHVTIFILMCVMSTLVSYSLALLIAIEMRVKTNCTRVLMALAITMSFIAITGICNRYDSMPFFFQWVSAYSYVRYSFEGAVFGIYGFGRETLPCEEGYCQFSEPREILKYYGLNEETFSIDWMALVFMFFALQGFIVLSLYWKIRSNRSAA